MQKQLGVETGTKIISEDIGLPHSGQRGVSLDDTKRVPPICNKLRNVARCKVGNQAAKLCLILIDCSRSCSRILLYHIRVESDLSRNIVTFLPMGP